MMFIHRESANGTTHRVVQEITATYRITIKADLKLFMSHGFSSILSVKNTSILKVGIRYAMRDPVIIHCARNSDVCKINV